MTRQTAKKISDTGRKMLDKAFKDYESYMIIPDFMELKVTNEIKQNIIEIIECERLTAATLAIDKFYT